MKAVLSTEYVDVPSDVKGKVVSVKGPRGLLVRDFSHVDIELTRDQESNRLKLNIWHGLRRHRALVRTVKSHIRNMVTGVTKGYLFKMRYVYAHFPINLNISEDGKLVEIRNFLGEKNVRKVPILDDVEISISKAQKDEIILQGNDIEKVSLSCAKINQATRIKDKDIRKFLDGIYVSEKTTVVKDE